MSCTYSEWYTCYYHCAFERLKHANLIESNRKATVLHSEELQFCVLLALQQILQLLILTE